MIKLTTDSTCDLNEEIIKKAEELELEYLTDDCVYATLRNKE